MNLFAERYTDRTLQWFHAIGPASWFQSLTRCSFHLCAVLRMAWIALAKRNLNPSAPAKFAIARHVDGFRMFGHGRRGIHRCRGLESTALLADTDLLAAHPFGELA